ncbi:hypothetical protein [Gordonia amicalis]|uniref:hypothetical protein n=1 Tax=Gordonia amicalis TaxID=89053 RepID=UPI0015F572D7|nr:hypothetical protein [Gordonia amicalis]MBA5846175.1 hypothetical protein [Gordonia amicalis]
MSGSASPWFNDAGQVGQALIDAWFNGFYGTTVSDVPLSHIEVTGSQIDQRYTALEGGGTRLYVPSSTTLDPSAYPMVEVAM